MNSEADYKQINTCLYKEKATEEVRGTLNALVVISNDSSPQRLHKESKEEDELVKSPGRVDS
jgi:hypothetical protein